MEIYDTIISVSKLFMMSKSIFKKVGASVMAGLSFAALLLMIGNGGNIPWFPPAIVFSLVGVSLITAIVFPFIWQFREHQKKISSIKIYAFLYSFIRFCIAINLVSFGWKKVFGLQFVVPAEIAGKPMNQQTGEWLTWFYFGYSPALGLIIAAIQIAGAYLILYSRTVLLGAIILFSLMLNITLVNLFYQMNAGALLQSVILTLGLLYLIMLHYKQLIEFFLKKTSRLPSLVYSNQFGKNIIRVLVIMTALFFTAYLKSLIK